MAGHSKWHNIKHRKEAQDKKRATLFTRLAREITIAARDGSDPDANPTLRLAVERARSVNMPNINIDRAIKRGSGEEKEGQLESILYDAVGPAGIPLLIQVITDNRNRTVSELRHILEQHGGSIAEPGSVRWMFCEQGVLYATLLNKTSHDEAELEAIEAGADEIEWDNDLLRIFVPRDHLHTTKTALASSQILSIDDAGLEWIPTTLAADPHPIDGLIETLDEHDDVTNIFT